MQAANEDSVERRGIEREALVPTDNAQAAGRENAVPLRPSFVVMHRLHAMRLISYPVHKSQQNPVESALIQVILDQDMPASFPPRLFQQLLDVEGVVKDVNKHADIDGVIAPRNARSVEALALDQARGSGRHFKSLNGGRRVKPPDEITDRP